MSDISFISTVRRDSDFVETVNQQVADIKRHLRKLPANQRPVATFKTLSNENAIFNQVVSTKKILHFAAHGNYFKRFEISSGREIKYSKIDSFVDVLVQQNLYLDVPVIIMDACHSGGFFWRWEFSKIVGPRKKLILIGSPHQIPMPDAIEFFDLFYGYLLSKPLPSRNSMLLSRVEESFNLAQEAFRGARGKYSRMRIKTLLGY